MKRLTHRAATTDPTDREDVPEPSLAASPHRLERRRFLQSAALGAVGIAAGGRSLGGLRPMAAASRTHDALLTSVRINRPPFYSGSVASVTALSLTVTATDGSSVTLTLTPSTSFWKEGSNTTNWQVISPGDQVYVRGISGPAPITAERVWANIAWRRGTIASVGSSQFVVQSQRQGTNTVQWTPSTEFYSGNGSTQQSSQSLVLGQMAEALGYFVSDGTFTATRVFLSPQFSSTSG